ncbi:fas-associated death domain protein [Lutzomyia longipalpis]|uniref:fas-associated death domain protein n=1 Tax=Lutzomyia longipalpis TaxID=7200 RepID=UPI0024833E18|nr:fas-associated death domain protein [Lutzomyia longipalpis]
MSPREKFETVKMVFIRSIEETESLNEVKEEFIRDVSCRRLERITTPTDLLNTLEAQSLIGENTVTGFKRISNKLQDAGLRCVTENFMQEILKAPECAYPGVNQYEEERKNQLRLSEIYSEGNKKKTPDEEELVTREKRDEIFRIIADEIGKKWMDFARALGFRQGKIDTLRDHPARIHVILEEVESTHPHREVFSMILTALEKSRRKDMRDRIQRILLEK